jgi:hypothetical protein
MQHGDPAAARSLAARRAALKGIAGRGERQALLMRRAKANKGEEREEARRLPERLAAVHRVNQARAQYGTGLVEGTQPVRQLLPGERCQYPAVPLRGAKCPQCGWTFGRDIEPHVLGGVPADIAPCGDPGCLCGGRLAGHGPRR